MYRSPRIISGGSQSGVPVTLMVSSTDFSRLKPKSLTFVPHVELTRMFMLLRSRWMIGGFILWRYAMPRDVSIVMRKIGLAHDSWFSGFRSTAKRSPRSRNSVTKQLSRHRSRVMHTGHTQDGVSRAVYEYEADRLQQQQQ